MVYRSVKIVKYYFQYNTKRYYIYSQALRVTLERSSSVKVFELMSPLVNTEFSQAIGGSKGIAPEAVAEDLLNALENDGYEVRVGRTEDLYRLFLSSPGEALNAMNPNEAIV